MTYSNTNTGYGQNYAHFAQSARPQIELTGVKRTEAEAQTSPSFPDFIYSNAPQLLQDACAVLQTSQQRDMFFTSALTVLSGVFDSIAGLYAGKMQNANLYCFLIAPPASDKSVMNWAKELGMSVHSQFAALNETEGKRFKAEYAAYKSALNEPGSVAMPPADIKIKTLFIPANSSATAVMKHIQDNNGSGVICETEADTLTNTFKQDWGNFDDLLRKAFHQEMFSYSRITKKELVEVHNAKIAVALSGTPAQVSKLLGSNENGLVSRFLFYYSDTPAAWRDVSPSGNANLDEHFKALSGRVLEIYNRYKDTPIEFQLTNSLWSVHNEMFKSWLREADTDMGSAIKRLGLIVFKIAMVLSILRAENTHPEEGKLVCNDVDYRIAMLLAERYRIHTENVYNTLLSPGNVNTDAGKMRLLEALPDEQFPKKTAIAIGAMLGMAERTVGKYINLLCAIGKLQQPKYGTYCKL